MVVEAEGEDADCPPHLYVGIFSTSLTMSSTAASMPPLSSSSHIPHRLPPTSAPAFVLRIASPSPLQPAAHTTVFEQLPWLWLWLVCAITAKEPVLVHKED